MRERRFPEPRGAAQKDVIQHVAALFGRLNEYAQVFKHFLLTAEFIETIGPEHALGAMAAITLPGGAVPTALDPLRPFDPIHYRLRQKWKIQVPAYWLAKTDGTRQRVLRLTAAVYNTVEQFEYLAEALVSELKGESGG